MKISSSRIYSGQNIPAYKKNKSLNENKNRSNSNEPTTKADAATQSKSIAVSSFQENQTIFKERIPYSNKRALSEYFKLNNLEKREYAQAALGFSAYA